MSSSFFVNITNGLYKKLVEYYDASITHKIVEKLVYYSKCGVISKFIINIFSKPSKIDFKEESIFVKFFDGIINFFNNILNKIIIFITKIGKSSVTFALFENVIFPLKNLGLTTKGILFLGFGFFCARMIINIILFGFGLNIILVNGILASCFFVLGIQDHTSLENMTKNNLIAKLIKWFFID